MKHKLLWTLGLIVLAMVAFVTGPAGAQTVANGPYYATPSWDQKLQCDTPATCPRFIVLSNWNSAAVLDRETGLVWERSPSTSAFNWTVAQSYCNILTLGNRKGWRMPTVQELASLVDPMQSDPALPDGHPFQNVRSSSYWSATTTAGSTSYKWGVGFGGGGVGVADKSSDYFVWCVRGGQGVDPQ